MVQLAKLHMKTNRHQTASGAGEQPSALAPSLSQLERQLNTLYAALDNHESGMLVLNAELRVVYANTALFKVFKSTRTPEEIRVQNPPYEDLLRDAARANQGAIWHYDRGKDPVSASAAGFDDYVARRLEWVRSGSSTPSDLKMTCGKVVRCHQTVLPDGGRMLVYSDVTDIMHYSQELERLATTDGMTGIYNRRHFLALADREWERTRRYDRPLALLMLDIDNFKSINDTFGHQTGDDMIVHLAGLACACKRGSDVLARLGGEEFALLLPETEASRALVLAERLRSEVAASPVVAPSRSISATVSIGVAERVAEMSGFSQLMSVADKALYEAKCAGRNRVICLK